MAIKRSCHSWARLFGDRGKVIDRFQWGLAASTIGVGALSLSRQSEMRQVLESCINIHALFGLLLVGFSLMRLILSRQHSPLEAPALRALARELSRLLYLFIYGAIGLRQIISITRHIGYGEPIDFNPADQFHKGPDFAGFDPNNDFQAFFASGLAALVFVRALLYGMWLRVADRSGVVDPGPARYAKSRSEPKVGMKPLLLAAALTTMCCLHGSSIVYAANSEAIDHGSATSYTMQHQYVLGGSGGWDYLTVDSTAHRLFISRNDRVLVMNTRDGSLEATIPDTPGVHGIALAPELGRGFTSNGRADTVTEFDLKSLVSIITIAVKGQNPDAILYDRFSKDLFTFNGRSQDVSVIDPGSHAVIAKIPVGGKPEFAVSNERGGIFFNIETTSQLGVIDSLAAKRIARWPLPNCTQPTGLALDAAHQRLFSVCANGVLVVTDAATGRHVAELPIGQGPDAAAFDGERGVILSSNGQDGTLTVIHEDDPDHYSVVGTIATEKSARTLALDAMTHEVYLVAAQFGAMPEPSLEQPHPRPSVLDGTFKVMVLGN